VNRNTTHDWFNCFRKEILKFQEKENGSFQDGIELDELYLGGPRKKLHANDRRKRNIRKIKESVDEEQKIKYRSLASKREVTVPSIPKSSKTPQERRYFLSFVPH